MFPLTMKELTLGGPVYNYSDLTNSTIIYRWDLRWTCHQIPLYNSKLCVTSKTTFLD